MYRKVYEQMNLAKQPIDAYMSNPIQKYILIKRATVDWDRVKPLIGIYNNVFTPLCYTEFLKKSNNNFYTLIQLAMIMTYRKD